MFWVLAFFLFSGLLLFLNMIEFGLTISVSSIAFFVPIRKTWTYFQSHLLNQTFCLKNIPFYDFLLVFLWFSVFLIFQDVLLGFAVLIFNGSQKFYVLFCYLFLTGSSVILFLYVFFVARKKCFLQFMTPFSAKKYLLPFLSH